jgi:hypothetical protein
VIVYNDVAHCLLRAQPERQRLAEMMPSDKLLSYQDMLSVVESLLSLCTKDYDVFPEGGTGKWRMLGWGLCWDVDVSL